MVLLGNLHSFFYFWITLLSFWKKLSQRHLWEDQLEPSFTLSPLQSSLFFRSKMDTKAKKKFKRKKRRFLSEHELVWTCSINWKMHSSLKKGNNKKNVNPPSGLEPEAGRWERPMLPPTPWRIVILVECQRQLTHYMCYLIKSFFLIFLCAYGHPCCRESKVYPTLYRALAKGWTPSTQKFSTFLFSPILLCLFFLLYFLVLLFWKCPILCLGRYRFSDIPFDFSFTCHLSKFVF